MTADQILQKHEDANEMHFHKVDREWIIQAMDEYATYSQIEISDEEIENFASDFYDNNGSESIFIMGAKWYREQLKNK